MAHRGGGVWERSSDGGEDMVKEDDGGKVLGVKEGVGILGEVLGKTEGRRKSGKGSLS